MALTAQQDSEVQQAVGSAGSAKTGDEANSDITSYLSTLGDWDPSQLAALSSDHIQGGGSFTGAQPNSGWAQQIEGAEAGVSPAGTPSSATPPTGLPTATDVTQTAPLPLSAFGPTASVTPTYATAATVDPNANYGYLQAQEKANADSLQPTFQQQDQTNQDQLAARGISSSGAAGEITGQLYGSQAATLAGMNAPAIAQQAGYTQQDVTNNQANEQGTSIFNAGEGTGASGANAGYYQQGLTGDATAYNGYLATLEQQGYNTGNEAYTAWLNSYNPNSGVTAGYNGAVGGIGSTYGNVYDNASNVQGSEITGATKAAGSAAAGG